MGQCLDQVSPEPLDLKDKNDKTQFFSKDVPVLLHRTLAAFVTDNIYVFCVLSALPHKRLPLPKKKKGNFNSYILILFCWAYFCPDLHLSKLPGQNSVC